MEIFSYEVLVPRIHVIPVECKQNVTVKNGIVVISRQRDSSSYGVFVLKWADCISIGIELYFDKQSICLMRTRIELEIILWT